MQKKVIYVIVGLALLVCIYLALGLGNFLLNFPDSLFGQNYLFSEFRPYSPRAYQSAEFVLGQVPLDEVERAFFIQTRDEALFWDPYYVGFPRAELSRAELSTIYKFLSQGVLFHTSADGKSFECVRNLRLEPCADGKNYQRIQTDRRWAATENRSHATLVLYMENNRLVEIRLAPSSLGLAFTPVEKSGDWWLNGLAESSDLLEILARRAKVSPIQPLWPELSAEQANAWAAWQLGARYKKALDFVQGSSAVQKTFGVLREIRPAQGSNGTSDWMDSNGIFLTLKVSGSHGEGAVIVQGQTCFNLQMVLDGQLQDDGEFYICP